MGISPPEAAAYQVLVTPISQLITQKIHTQIVLSVVTLKRITRSEFAFKVIWRRFRRPGLAGQPAQASANLFFLRRQL